jgi:hypothetical protein
MLPVVDRRPRQVERRANLEADAVGVSQAEGPADAEEGRRLAAFVRKRLRFRAVRRSISWLLPRESRSEAMSR